MSVGSSRKGTGHLQLRAMEEHKTAQGGEVGKRLKHAREDGTDEGHDANSPWSKKRRAGLVTNQLGSELGRSPQYFGVNGAVLGKCACFRCILKKILK